MGWAWLQDGDVQMEGPIASGEGAASISFAWMRLDMPVVGARVGGWVLLDKATGRGAAGLVAIDDTCSCMRS